MTLLRKSGKIFRNSPLRSEIVFMPGNNGTTIGQKTIDLSEKIIDFHCKYDYHQYKFIYRPCYKNLIGLVSLLMMRSVF